MNSQDWIVLLAAVLGGGGILGALVQALRNRADSRLGQKTDWASYASEMRQALQDERQANREDGERRDERIAALQESLSTNDHAIRLRDRYIEHLRHQIWEHRGPPPDEPLIPYR